LKKITPARSTASKLHYEGQTTRHVEEALMRLTEPIGLATVDEAQTAAAVLGHNFPDSASGAKPLDW
jgi:outer membrane protein assembly factor BamD (BamD/ComL family)